MENKNINQFNSLCVKNDTFCLKNDIFIPGTYNKITIAFVL